MQLEIEKRSAPRLETNSAIDLFPNNMRCSLVNISETGVCFECNGSVLSGDVQLSLNLSSGRAQKSTPISARVVHYVPVANNRNRYGVQFASLDTNLLNQLREKIFDEYAKRATVDIERAEVKKAVEEFFKSDVRQYHEGLCELTRQAANGKLEPDEIENRVTTLTNETLIKGGDLEKKVANEAAMKTIKQVFRDIAGCWFYKGPIVKMAYDKPRGYPGDYYLFETIYDNKSLAEKGSIGYYCDRYFLHNAYAQAVRARKNKMKNILQDLIENTNLETIKLLNIACGPSREIRELLSDSYLSARKKLIFTGLDNDEDALKFSQTKLNNLPPNVQVRLLNENVLNIFRDSKYYDIIGKQDIIYILGLTEYLPERIFRKLTDFLFQLLNDKGMLVITYKDEAIEFPSLPPEWLCDWAFIKRTKDDLIETTKALGSDRFSLNIEREGTGTIFFLILTKT